jgi:flagellar biosynthesis/type III secretory pathway M-ring protein FliF/YscJ
MKQLLGTLWAQFVAAGAPARWAVAAVLTCVIAIGGFSVYQAKNPHFEVLVSDLDSAMFSRAVAALASEGIRYKTTMPPGPFTVFVESPRKYEALNAIHLAGDFTGPARGIDADVTGSAAMFLGSRERDQRSEKRDWQETELQLEQLVWVSRAFVKVSGSTGSTLLGARRDDRRASVLVNLRGGVLPDAAQRRTLASTVSNSTGVPLTHVTVTDHLGNMLFNGSDEFGLESQLALERAWQSDLERRLQALLDQAFGPGVTIVGVNGQWSHVRQESVEETLDPSKKPRSKRTLKVENPSQDSPEPPLGGPAGTYANTADGQSGPSSAGSIRSNAGGNGSTNESEESYAFGSKTTHLVAQPHVLEKMSISLIVDDSIADKLEIAAKSVKGWATFDEERGDIFEAQTLTLAGLARDDTGKPLPPEPTPKLEPANPLFRQLLEHGIEIAAAVAFLLILMRSLKGASQAARGVRVGGGAVGAGGTATIKLGVDGKPMLADLLGDEEIDLDLLARKHVEELLEKDPEKVSALLSRWALGEQFYAGTGSR